MAVFPTNESDTLVLANTMISGYTTNPLDFPSANLALVTGRRDSYQTAYDAMIIAYAAYRDAVEDKDSAFDLLKTTMQFELKQSEVDTNNDAGKLAAIGWGPRGTPTPAIEPGQPRLLEAVTQGIDSVFLDWKGAAPATGGPVRTYVIERQDDPLTEWTQVAIAMKSEVMLTAQPRGVAFRYRVKGVNTGGESVPSNTVDVVL